MELLVTVLAAKCTKSIQTAFKNELPVKYFSDSQVTLFCLEKNHEIYKPFVANRLLKIKNLIQIEDWHYINTETNFSGDIASRGLSVEEFCDDKRWWEGPTFILNPDHNYSFMKIYEINKLTWEKI